MEFGVIRKFQLSLLEVLNTSFKLKHSRLQQKKKNTYEDVINHMKNYSGADISLEDALSIVTTPDVSSYIMSIVNEENKKVSK